MIDPLARPPLGPRAIEPARDFEAPAPAVGTARIAAFADEVRAFVSDLDARRIGWGLTRCLPAFTFSRTRARLLALTGCDVGHNTAVTGFVRFVGPRDSVSRLRIGPGCIIGPDVTFCLDAPISVGKNVSIGPRAVLYTATHALGGAPRRMQLEVMARAIVVEDGAWIGLAATILAGVRVGRGAVVSAGAVVNEDVPENVLVAGNPARVVQELPRR